MLGLVRYVVGFPLSFYVSEKLSTSVYNSTVKPKVIEYIDSKVSSSEGIEQLRNSINDALSVFPDFMKQGVDLSALDVDNKKITQDIMNSGLESSLISITKGFIFVLTLLLFFIISSLIIKQIIKLKRKKEQYLGNGIVSTVDRCFGALLGVFKAFVSVLAFVSILYFIQDLWQGTDNAMITQIETSRLMPLLNQVNPINFIVGG